MRTSTSAFLASSQRCRLEGEHEGLSLVSACFFRLCVDRDTQISEISNARMQLTRASHPRDQRHQALLQEGRLDAPSGSSGVHRMRHVPSIPVEVAATLVILERARVTELDAGGGGQRVSQQVATHTVNARASDAQHGAQARGTGPGILRGVTLHAHLLHTHLLGAQLCLCHCQGRLPAIPSGSLCCALERCTLKGEYQRGPLLDGEAIQEGPEAAASIDS